MPLFQYQQRSEPLGAIGADPSKWLPSVPHLGRKVVSIAALVAGTVGPLAPLPTASQDWQQEHPQPSRFVTYAQGTTRAEPIGSAPIAYQSWQQQHVQPSRKIAYADGTTHVENLLPIGNPSAPALSITVYPSTLPGPVKLPAAILGTRFVDPVKPPIGSSTSFLASAWSPPRWERPRPVQSASVGPLVPIVPDPPDPPPFVTVPIRADLWLVLARRRRYAQPSPTPPAPTVSPVRDRQILRAMADALRATGEFDKVTTGGLPENGNDFGSDVTRACVLELVSWSVNDDDTADDLDGEDMIRTVLFTVWVMVRDEEPDIRDNEVDRLGCLVADTVGNTSFLDATLPGLTYFLNGVWMRAEHPERRYRMDGHTAYIVESWQSNNTDIDS